MWPLSNLKGFAKTRPPLVIFMLCLCAFAIILLSLSYYIEKNEVQDPDLSYDWNTFLTSFSQLRFCFAESPATDDVSLLSPKLDLNLGLSDSGKDASNPEMDISSAARKMTNLQSSNGELKHHAVNLMITVHPTLEFLSANSNSTHLSGQIRGHHLGLSGPVAQLPMNISFILPSDLNHTKCAENSTCDPITVQTCVFMEGIENIFPNTKTPKVCEKPVLNATYHQSYVRGFQDYTVTKLYMCRHMTEIIIHYESQPTLTVMLSLHDRSLIALHLVHTSCFLFVMVVTLLFYAVMRGRPVLESTKYHTAAQSI